MSDFDRSFSGLNDVKFSDAIYLFETVQFSFGQEQTSVKTNFL